jgi:toxin ParE1/3/4
MFPLAVQYAGNAHSDIESIFDYIAKDNPSAARKVLAAIEAEIERLSYFPWKSRKTDEEGIMARTLSRYPYIIFYRVERDALVILHVLHGARRHPGFQEAAAEFVR